MAGLSRDKVFGVFSFFALDLGGKIAFSTGACATLFSAADFSARGFFVFDFGGEAVPVG